MNHIKQQVVIITLLAIVMVGTYFPRQVSAEKGTHIIMVPIGRSVLFGENDFSISVDGEPIDVSVVYDEYGGYWAEIPFDLARNEEFVWQVTRVRGPIPLFKEPSNDLARWLASSRLIDSENPILTEVALDLTAGVDTNAERAQIISDFVSTHLRFQRVVPFHSLLRASHTYELGFGTCVNFARLFVALSRAAGVPARTVWGVIRGSGAYDYHHEWAEYLDDEGYWHPADFTYTSTLNLSDVRYLDLIYSAEENPWYEALTSELYQPDRERLFIVDSSRELHDGRIGFVVIEYRYPQAFVLEQRFSAVAIPDLLPQFAPFPVFLPQLLP